MNRSAVVLEADGLGKCFGTQAVLTAASFSARRATVTALMGRNGAGKSTMFRITVGRIGSDYGRVVFNGEFLDRPNLASMARNGLFYSAQDSALTGLFTIEQHLRAVADVYGQDGDYADVVERLALREFLGRKPWAVSGGERQRASLAMAILRRPTCLLMDEPFVGVAPRDRPLIAEGLRGLRDDGCAIVISGHDVHDIFAVSDEIIWVVAGTTHGLGSPEAARANHQFRREYLGPRG